ncbi:MAG: FAD-dependent oxidoreductase [Spirochaetota bacterium]|nr:FAD-dependent oxidoreductase [Spirochaetota bacterium]
MKKIVIIGGSFGGLITAFEIRKRIGRKVEIILVSDQDEFIFIPSLPWVIAGWKDPSKIKIPLKKLLASKNIHFIHKKVIKIDCDKLKISVSNEEIPYDYLVIATGSAFSFDAIDGMGPSKYTHSVLTLSHALKAKESLKSLLSNNKGDIVLGNAQGASCLGPSYELAMMFDTLLRRAKIRNSFKLHLFSPEPYLGHFGIGGIGKYRRAIEDEFYERDIFTHLNAEIEGITPKTIELKDKTILNYDFSIIMPAFKGVDAIFNSDSIGNTKGFIPADEYYRHPKFQNIYTVGVAMAMSPPEITKVPVGVPKTGNMTQQMAIAAASHIISDIKGEQPSKTKPLSVACIADAGNTGIIFKLNPVLPPREKIYFKKAKWAHFAKEIFEKYFMWKIKNW